MARARVEYAHEVVDLASDSEDEVLSGDELEFFDAQAERQDAMEDYFDMDGTPGALNAHYSPFHEAANGVIDLTGIPDIDVPPSDPTIVDFEAGGPDNLYSDAQLVTEAMGLQMVLDFLPDISIDHVLNLIREKTADLTRTVAQCQNIIMQLVEDGIYPKEADEAKNKKRKRDAEDEWKDYDEVERCPEVPNYESDA
jgi:TRIAD3 protein (E3 ubiquitin-protein ligase RNF216)